MAFRIDYVNARCTGRKGGSLSAKLYEIRGGPIPYSGGSLYTFKGVLYEIGRKLDNPIKRYAAARLLQKIENSGIAAKPYPDLAHKKEYRVNYLFPFRIVEDAVFARRVEICA